MLTHVCIFKQNKFGNLPSNANIQCFWMLLIFLIHFDTDRGPLRALIYCRKKDIYVLKKSHSLKKKNYGGSKYICYGYLNCS